MKRTQHVSVRVSEEQKEALEQLARTRNVTIAHLMRHAVLKLSEESSIGKTAVVAREAPRTPRRNSELAWLSNQGDRIQRFAGQWIALSGDQLVSHGPDYLQVYQRAREAGVAVPFVEWIPETQSDVVWMGL